jgi:hypothetical protein
VSSLHHTPSVSRGSVLGDVFHDALNSDDLTRITTSGVHEPHRSQLHCRPQDPLDG